MKIIKISESKLPTKYGEFVIHVYKDYLTNIEHVALIKGDVLSKKKVMTRVHSECITGDIFSSERCDCGEQLKLAQALIESFGSGIIIYLRDHEGRGIGIGNKIAAYALQEKGFDTIEANEMLGFPIDARVYTVASEILKQLKVESINLLSNNPNKQKSLEILGVSVESRLPLIVPENTHNSNYLRTKMIRMHHTLEIN